MSEVSCDFIGIFMRCPWGLFMEFSETRDRDLMFFSARCNGILWDYHGITMNLNGISPTKSDDFLRV